MDKDLIIIACSFLVPEISHVIKTGDYPDVELKSFKANCSAQALRSNQVSEIIQKSEEQNKDILFIGATCLSIDEKLPGNFKVLHLEQDFDMFMNKETIEHFITKGFYIVTNGWLRSLEQHINAWGFKGNEAKPFFQESMSGILLLDTKIPGDYMPNLKALSDYMGLPYEIIPVGLSHCKNKIDGLIFDWRQDSDRKTLNKKISESSQKSADYSLIFHQLTTLVKLTDENEIINLGFDLLNLLFAPKTIKYVKLLDGEKEYYTYHGSQEIKQKDVESSFKIEISQGNFFYGSFEVIECRFPQFKDKYIGLSTVISQIFGLSIANARRFQTEILQKEKIEKYAKDLYETNLSKDKFFSIIAHDLKGPFNVLIGLSNVILEDLETNNLENVKEHSKIINRATKQTFNLLSNLLEWSRTKIGKIELSKTQLNLFDLSTEVIEILSFQANEKRVSILNKILPKKFVYGDKNMLKVILRNLITNAIKYTPPNGTIILSHSFDAGMSKIAVTDNGIGISRDRIDQLFKLEHSISTKGTNDELGTGLGLILSKEFVELNQGKIWVESELGVGSTFYFTLPN